MRMIRTLVILVTLGIIGAEIAPFASEVHACPISTQNMMIYALALHNYRKAMEMAEIVDDMVTATEKEALTDEQKQQLEAAKKEISKGKDDNGKDDISLGIGCLRKCNINANNYFIAAQRHFSAAKGILDNLPPHNR